ncbi:hypothetical protein LBMAG42_45930 [Deltaproteobacteria bacterium]|nr:hypothetical protein LBMAG42_45930 [Deltaproteobacteria bacterium]
MPRSRDALVWLALAAGFAGLAFTLGGQAGALLSRPGRNAVDLVPIWCHARALVAGEWDCGPEVMRVVFGRAPIGPDLGQSGAYYYPPTTALLFLVSTTGTFEQAARGFRALSVLSLLGAGFAIAFTAPPRSRLLGVAGGVAVAAAFFALRISRGSLLAGQTGPLMVGISAAALWAAGRQRDRLSGTLAAVGLALKLSPVLLLPALFRRRAWVLVFGVVVFGLSVVVMSLTGHDSPTRWFLGALAFTDRPMHAAWAGQEPPWVLVLWRWRLWGLGVPTAFLVLWSAVRPAGRDHEVATAFVLMAFGGAVMAGSQQTHEALVLLPALGWVLVWPVQEGPRWRSLAVSLLLAAYMVKLGVGSSFSPPNSLAWLPIAALTWCGCVARWAWSRRRAVSGGPQASAYAPTSAPILAPTSTQIAASS